MIDGWRRPLHTLTKPTQMACWPHPEQSGRGVRWGLLLVRLSREMKDTTVTTINAQHHHFTQSTDHASVLQNKSSRIHREINFKLVANNSTIIFQYSITRVHANSSCISIHLSVTLWSPSDRINGHNLQRQTKRDSKW